MPPEQPSGREPSSIPASTLPEREHVIAFPAEAALEPKPQPSVEAGPELPVWMQRLFLFIFVIFCVELGLVLLVVPWFPVWTGNAFVQNSPRMRAILDIDFVRGAVSGLGLLDIWVGIYEAVHHRVRRS
jgi:hypothetical protein